jgi:hypothetical protein
MSTPERERWAPKSPATRSAQGTRDSCVADRPLLHLQQICSKISLPLVEMIVRPDAATVRKPAGRCFCCFTRNYQLLRGLCAAKILEFKPRDA